MSPALPGAQNKTLFVSISEEKLEKSPKLKDKFHFKVITIFDRHGFVIADLKIPSHKL